MINKFSLAIILALCLFFNLALAQTADTAGNSPIIPQESGKISLDIKGMDIIDVLKMLATRANINIVVGKNVTGKVTLFLKEVDIWDAFEIVLLANELAYEKKGDIYNVMTQRDYELRYGERYRDNKQVRIIPLKYAKAADLSRALSQIKTNVGRVVADEASNTLALIDTPDKLNEMESFVKNTDLPLKTEVFSLNYAQAEKLQTKIQEILTKGVGYLRADERTNKIAITDYPQKLEEVGKIITAFDEKTPQVLIDAQILELTPEDKLQMGVDFNFWIEKYFQVQASLPVNTSNTLLIGTPPSRTVAGKGDYKSVIDLLRTIGDTKVLSSPRIMTLNNQEAKILVGTKDAYITSTTSQASTTSVTSQTVNFVDTGIKLYVTATVNRDDFVTMKIKPEISSAIRTAIKSEDRITEVPIVTTSEAETTVTVKDGVTIVIGGLRRDKREKTVKKIPLVGDIPGLGFLFRSTSDDLTKTELVILLTPHIMTGETSYTDFKEIKPKKGAIVKMENGNIITEKVDESDRAAQTESASDVDLYQYYKILMDKVKSLAYFGSPRGMQGDIKLAFVVSRDGNLVNEPTVLETTNPSLNGYSIKAIIRSSPFPPFPRSLAKEQESFKISLSYK